MVTGILYADWPIKRTDMCLRKTDDLSKSRFEDEQSWRHCFIVSACVRVGEIDLSGGSRLLIEAHRNKNGKKWQKKRRKNSEFRRADALVQPAFFESSRFFIKALGPLSTHQVRPFISQPKAPSALWCMDMSAVMYESRGWRWGMDSQWQRQIDSYPSLRPECSSDTEL